MIVSFINLLPPFLKRHNDIHICFNENFVWSHQLCPWYLSSSLLKFIYIHFILTICILLLYSSLTEMFNLLSLLNKVTRLTQAGHKKVWVLYGTVWTDFKFVLSHLSQGLLCSYICITLLSTSSCIQFCIFEKSFKTTTNCIFMFFEILKSILVTLHNVWF